MSVPSPQLQINYHRRYPGEGSGYHFGNDGHSEHDSDDSLNRSIRNRNSSAERFPGDGFPSYGEYGRNSSPFDRGRPRVGYRERDYYPRGRSWERVRGRSESLPGTRRYFGGEHQDEYGYRGYFDDDFGMDRVYPGNIYAPLASEIPNIYPRHTLSHIPPFDSQGNPLSIDVNLVDEKVPDWNDKGPVLKPKTLFIDASRGFTDEAEVEKIILTPHSKDDPDKDLNLRWVWVLPTNMYCTEY
jgi:hypothetical protein